MAGKSTKNLRSDPTPTKFCRFVKTMLLMDDTMYCEGFCISTDSKPTAIDGFPVSIGSKLIEVDTGKTYLFDPTENVGWTDQSFPNDAT